MTVNVIRDAQIWASKFCTLASVICRSSVRKLPHFIPSGSKNFETASRFLEIFTPLQYMASKLLHETGPDGVWLLVSDRVFGMHRHALKQMKT